MSVKSSQLSLSSKWSDPSIPFGSKCNEPTPTVLRQTYSYVGFRTGGRLDTLMFTNEIIINVPTVYNPTGSLNFSESSHASESVFESSVYSFNHVVSSDSVNPYSLYEFGSFWSTSECLVKSVRVGSKTVCIDFSWFDTDPILCTSESLNTAFESSVFQEHSTDQESSLSIYDLPEPFINSITRDACFVNVPCFSCLNLEGVNIRLSEYRVFSYPIPDSSVINIILMDESDLSLNLTETQTLKVHVKSHVDNIFLSPHPSIISVFNEGVSTILTLVILFSSFLTIFDNVFRLTKLTLHNTVYGPEAYILLPLEQRKSIKKALQSNTFI